MYNRLYNFLEKKEIIYSLQFGFRQKYCSTHALTHFIDFKEHFDTVDHHILLKKL